MKVGDKSFLLLIPPTNATLAVSFPTTIYNNKQVPTKFMTCFNKHFFQINLYLTILNIFVFIFLQKRFASRVYYYYWYSLKKTEWLHSIRCIKPKLLFSLFYSHNFLSLSFSLNYGDFLHYIEIAIYDRNRDRHALNVHL